MAGARAETIDGGRRRTVLIAAAIFWTAHYLLLLVRTMLYDYPVDPVSIALRRMPVHLCGFAISMAFFLGLQALRRIGLAGRIAALAALVLPAAGLYGLLNDLLVWYVLPQAPIEPYTPIMFWQAMFPWIGSFAAWAALLIAIEYGTELRERDRRLADVELLAREATMQALRFQMNPHFLFNTLNSISGLMWERDFANAEKMLVGLAAFLRATLEADPSGNTTLDEEIGLQQQYLSIEQVRFPKRLDVRCSVPDELRSARVPGMILQPIVENAVKHAVATSAMTQVKIAARAEERSLFVSIEDDGLGDKSAAAPGTGLGLHLVRRRLETCFGNSARLYAAPLNGGGYRAEIMLPLVFE
jgi:hypothetical protein